MSEYNAACVKIGIDLLSIQNPTKEYIKKLQHKYSKQYNLPKIPSIPDILATMPNNRNICAKPIRSASGVSIIAIMSKPHRCPHIAITGSVCIYCPGGPDSDFEYSSQSYTGYEPTSMRAIRHRYDPFEQIRNRIRQLESLGHPCSKIELIVMGGTFMSLDSKYKDWFIRRSYDGVTGNMSSTVGEAVSFATHSLRKLSAITIETRPDYCQQSHINDLLRYGCTRLEIGVQSVYEDVSRDTNRGHRIRSNRVSTDVRGYSKLDTSIETTFSLVKDAGYKIVSHLMPNLPNTSIERDIAQFIDFFESPVFRSDGLKIYPTLVIRGTGLYELYKNGLYRSYSPDQLIDLLTYAFRYIPPYVRVYRVQRDIPMPLVTSGIGSGNIREIIAQRMKDSGFRMRDIRSREVGIARNADIGCVRLIRRDYFANNGWETFLSYESSDDTLIAMLRLRKCSEMVFRKELIGGTCSVVRELHVYGAATTVSKRTSLGVQHKGFGERIMAEAEKISRNEHHANRIAVISGIGVRNYYKKLGYILEGDYMIKNMGTNISVNSEHSPTP